MCIVLSEHNKSCNDLVPCSDFTDVVRHSLNLSVQLLRRHTHVFGCIDTLRGAAKVFEKGDSCIMVAFGVAQAQSCSQVCAGFLARRGRVGGQTDSQICVAGARPEVPSILSSCPHLTTCLVSPRHTVPLIPVCHSTSIPVQSAQLKQQKQKRSPVIHPNHPDSPLRDARTTRQRNVSGG